MRAAKSGALIWVSADGIENHPFFIAIFFAFWVVVNIAAHLKDLYFFRLRAVHARLHAAY